MFNYIDSNMLYYVLQYCVIYFMVMVGLTEKNNRYILLVVFNRLKYYKKSIFCDIFGCFLAETCSLTLTYVLNSLKNVRNYKYLLMFKVLS